MDLNSHYQQLQQNQPNSRLLRFRSSFKQGEGGGGSATNSGETSSSTFREFMDHNPSNHKGDNNESSLSQRHMNSQQDYRMDQHKGFYTNLLRQSSSHAGHFSNNNIISFGNGYESMKGVENYDGVNAGDGELTLSMNILNNQIGFSPRMLSQNSKMGSDGIGTTSSDDRKQVGSNNDAQYYGHKFVYDSNDQNVGVRNQVDTLSHHLSLPRKSSEMFIVENLVQFPDSVPSSIRAKRGFATHPRSLAERVRRTRISERMRKLQEIVPNIDKQTCTSEMLDLAVEYIKELQKQLKTMSAKRAKCRCRNKK